MQRSSDHPLVRDLMDIRSVEIPKKSFSSPWEISSGLDNFRRSNDLSLFSASLPVLPHEKLNYKDVNHGGGVQSFGNASSNLHKDVNTKLSLDDLDVQFIGNLLPDDEDDLLAGITDDFDLMDLPSQLENLEEDDIFGSGGGLELEFDPNESLNVGVARSNLMDGFVGNGASQYNIPNSIGAVAGEHPYGEHPSRTLFVRNINSNVEDSELRSLFEQYGDIRTLYTSCKHRGFVMISYYDIRDSRNAMRSLQNKPLRRRKLDIHFSIPKDNPSDKDINQGTLVVFNLDSSVTNDELRQIFGVYGEVKEIRETPHKYHHKFIEYYDVRAAEAALRVLNRSDIAGKKIKLEPSRPGGARRNLLQQMTHEIEQDESRFFRHQVGSPPSTWGQFGNLGDNTSPLQSLSQSPTLGSISQNHQCPIPGANSPMSTLPLSKSIKIPPIGQDRGFNGIQFQHSHSFPENSKRLLSSMTSKLGTLSFGQSNSGISTANTLTGPQYLWGSPTLVSDQSRGSSAWTGISSRGHSFRTNNGQGLSYANNKNSFVTPSQNYRGHNVGSAPSGVTLDRRIGSYFPDSSDNSYMNSRAFAGVGQGYRRNEGNMNNMGTQSHASVNSSLGISGNRPEHSSHGFRIMSSQGMGNVFINGGSYSGLGSSGIEGLVEHGRNRRVEGNGSQIDCKRQYQLDLDRIISGEDNRTTLMIKNIPNKYTSKMLLAAIDENHKGTYDFLYLPIDFKNKCNVGYAFINMMSATQIISFYEAFNGKKWEKFNSEKVASLAYARIQGKTALIAHFQNSSLMNEDKRCRPILFHSEGTDSGNQDQFPLANINIQLHEPDRSLPMELSENSGMNLNELIENTN